MIRDHIVDLFVAAAWPDWPTDHPPLDGEFRVSPEVGRRLSVTPQTTYGDPLGPTESLWVKVSLRTSDGLALTITWGEPDADGMYTPTLHTADDGQVMVSRIVLDELERRAGGLP